jgi:hypothetical protein
LLRKAESAKAKDIMHAYIHTYTHIYTGVLLRKAESTKAKDIMRKRAILSPV